MEESYLASLLVSFLFAFVLFKKDKTVTVKIVDKSSALNSYRKASGSTGVAKYLQEKEMMSDESEQTDNSSVSGVAKYLATRDVAVSGVSKYMARQSIQAKKTAKENVSGVEKYLNNRS
ncbi:MAG: hypothetical protein KAT04_12265 [Methylococcales bacterium]|nr:hypothetical protein [Methylococcales bacterium]